MASLPSAASFRKVCSRFATGVTIVTLRDPDGTPHGMTANSFTSVSLEPPLVSVCIDRRTRLLDWLNAGSPFAVNVLGVNQSDLSSRFARPGEDRFGNTRWNAGAYSTPLIQDTLGYFECRVTSTLEAGDHVIVVGEVLSCECREGEPLIFFGGSYRELSGV
jgi:flavin reductase (DIM6/NTAB) family NADH-FMN oxidoreductase RutF